MFPLSLRTSFIKQTLASVGGLPAEKRSASRWWWWRCLQTYERARFFSRKCVHFPEHDKQDVSMTCCSMHFCEVFFSIPELEVHLRGSFGHLEARSRFLGFHFQFRLQTKYTVFLPSSLQYSFNYIKEMGCFFGWGVRFSQWSRLANPFLSREN